MIYKILRASEWERFQADGRFAGSAKDVADGFIHLSAAGQAPETAARHFAGQGGLVLAEIDPEGLDLRWEPSRGGALFPHLYAQLPLSAVTRSWPLPLGPDGRHLFPAAVLSYPDPETGRKP